MNIAADTEKILEIVNAECRDPFGILGIHKVEGSSKSAKGFAVRAFLPNAKSVRVVDDETGNSYVMEKIHENGFFEVIIADKKDFFLYKYEILDFEGNSYSTYDPYRFLPVISDFDLYLFNEGNQHKIFEKLGAHITTIDGIKGTLFAVWAPCAKRVSVVGNFNQWDGRKHQMRSRGCSGVWEIFIPGVNKDEIYKYEIKTPHNELYLKADPYAFYSELRPGTASVIYDLDDYKWNDDNWIKNRSNNSTFDKPVSIYELHFGSWARNAEDPECFLTYTQMADSLIKYVKDMGYTHIELLPISEYPFDGSWGYQITGYYSVTSRYGKPEEFMYFVDKCHENGIGIILDWVPAHFPKDGHGLARFDGTALYEHYDQRQGEHPDWGTHIFNYSRHEVRNFLVSNAVFWFEKYHIDGLRIDAVASMLYLDYAKKEGEWVPNKWGGKENVDAIDFMRQLNTTVYKYFPNVMMIAEESTSWALVSKPPHVGGLGFSYKWNMGWMNDFLTYISKDPIYRKYHQSELTFSSIYAFSENFILVLSHDEVVHGKCSMINKMPGDYWQKFAGLRGTYGYMYAHPGKKLLFMGSEFGQFIEWNYQSSLDWHLLDYEMHGKMKNYVRDLNNLYKNEPALYEVDFHHEGFEWIDCNDADNSIISFVRKAKDWKNMIIVVCNFTPELHTGYRIGVPVEGFYEEIMNSDSEIYGGSNKGNKGGLNSEKIECHGKPNSLCLTIPPLGVVYLKLKNK
ncbi:MAG: 1,4-alpha-glucan branching protein GlgB [Bacillota bacterium]|nr:1,4-alpha-glucan branching protein GlgB [Bacillota bacterium]